ncbi:MAG: DUF547 domain-containing protein [Nitrospirota bacterium]|nr:MAG: DUF547 domain-containing protein [Nitrospirota bacterium]
MSKLFILIILLIIATAFPAFGNTSFDFTEYESLLEKYVKTDVPIKGFTITAIDYGSLYGETKGSTSDYSVQLHKLSNFDPATINGRSDIIAFWINVYNIGAIKMILDHYPVDSIRSSKIHLFKNPWNKKVINVGGREYSLGEIEHDILLGELKELMAHYGIVCASLSCPEISPDVYTGGKLQEQLARQARIFLSDPKKGLQIDRVKNIVHVSSIYKYDKTNFKRNKDIIIPFILPNVENGEDREYLQNAQYTLEFLDYNWELNLYTDQ